MKTELVAAQYYEGEGISFPYLVAEQNNSGLYVYEQTGALMRHEEDIDPQDVDEAMNEVARSLMVVEHGGSFFEIATTNMDAPSSDVMLHISTYSSAISTNHGNGYEFAAQAVRYPNHRHLYVASFGNGSTSPLLPQDVDYVRKTGRFTKDIDGQSVPIESLQNLHAALAKQGLSVTRLMGTDSAGGHYARALSVAMESGQLSHAFFSETSGFVNLSVGRMVVGMLVKENIFNSKQNRAISSDPEKIDDAKIARFTKAFERYADLPNRRKLEEAKVSTKETLSSMHASLTALKRGPRHQKNPLADDTNALIAKHPGAKLTYGAAEHDPLYKNSETSRKAAELFLRSLVLKNSPVKVALIPGMTHAYNTYFPSLYHAVKRNALELS